MIDSWGNVIWELGFHTISALLFWRAVGGLLMICIGYLNSLDV